MLRFMLLTYLVLNLCSCGSGPVSSSVKHDIGRFQNSPSAQQWAEISEKNFESITAKTIFNPQTLPQDEPMTKRLQLWADRIRKVMIEVSPELANAPRPLVRIIQAEGVNAFINVVTSCINVDLVGSSDKLSQGSVPLFMSNSRGGSVGCIFTDMDLESKRKFVEYDLQLDNGPACKVRLDGKTLVANDVCSKNWPQKSYTQFASNRVYNYLTVFKDLTKKMPEEEVVAVMAHELGHYYMAHQMHPDMYNYLYAQSKQTDEGKPLPLNPGDALYSLASKIQTTMAVPPRPFPNQKYPTGLIQVVIKMLIDRSSSLGDVCLSTHRDCIQDFLDLKESSRKIDAIIGRDPAVSLSSLMTPQQERTIYAKFEADLVRIAPVINARTLTVYLGALLPFADFDAGNLPTEIDLLTYLNRLAPRIDQAIAKRRVEFEALSKVASENGLTRYTIEQEADDIATDVVNRLGFDTDVVVQENFTLMALASSADLADCRQNFESGFLRPVWAGSDADIHHDSCFRAYNSFQESKRHQEAFAKTKGKPFGNLPGEKTWAELVAGLPLTCDPHTHVCH